MNTPAGLPHKASATHAAGLMARAASGILLWALASVGAAVAPAQSLNIVAEHNRRAVALAERGELEGAVTEWREALRVAPGNVTILLNLGISLLRLGRADEAEEVLQEAVRLDYQRARAHLFLGQTYMRQGNNKLAEVEFATAQKLDPTDPSIDIALAELAFQRGERQVAEDHLKRALTFRYNDPHVHAALGDVYRADKSWSEAEKAYRKALSLDASHRGANRGLRALKRERRWALASAGGASFTHILRVEDPITRIERGRYVVEGQVVNTSERMTAKHVTIVARFYTKDQRLLSVEETETKPADLGPGERGAWRLSVAYSPELSEEFEIAGTKAIIEDPEAASQGAGPPRPKRPTFFGGDDVEPGDVLKVSIPKSVTREDNKSILRGFVVNVGENPVASIDLIIGLVERKTGSVRTQDFARIERQILNPGERAGYTIELKERYEPDRFRPTMKVSWAELPAARSPEPEASQPGPKPKSRLPTPIPKPLPTRPRH